MTPELGSRRMVAVSEFRGLERDEDVAGRDVRCFDV